MRFSIPKPISFIMVFGSVVSGLLALVIICVPILTPIWEDSYQTPDMVKQWGGGNHRILFRIFYNSNCQFHKGHPGS